MGFWKGMSIILALIFISSAVPRILLMLEKEEQDCGGFIKWVKQSNAPVMIGVALSIVALVLTLFIRG